MKTSLSFLYVNKASKSFHSPICSSHLASSRGQSSPTIASTKPTSLSATTTTSGKHEAERQKSRDDNVAIEPGDVVDSNKISENILSTDLGPLRSRFENCKEFLRKAYTAHPPAKVTAAGKTGRKIPCSKSASNIHSFTLEDLPPSKEELIISEGVGGGGDGLKDFATTRDKQCETIKEDSLDEVEIVSLLEERIPKYKLRADCITRFSGCANEDFQGIPFPALCDFSPVTPEQAYLTFGYFLLSGERVSQMTKTFSDVDALQKLLEEKEKDLELAARIGQQLLEQNRNLEERVTTLEHENRESTETLTQLKHDLLFKQQLLELYNDSCNSEENSKAGTPIGSAASVLERRVANLEEENSLLRTEACRIAEDVEKTEAEEKYLVEDAIRRLAETNSRVKIISDDFVKKSEECARQSDEILKLSDEVQALQEVNRELLEDNATLSKTLESLQACQGELSTEIVDLKDNYVEVVAILKETQEQLREAQKQRDSGAEIVSVFDSLAYEIESSVARQRKTSDYFRRTFDTVRCANHKINDANSSSALMSSVSSLGYQSLQGSSCLSSLDSSAQDPTAIGAAGNPCQALTISGSDLGSSICLSPGGSTPGSDKLGWRMPEKLQIVKPLEGSATLQVWSALATPHLGNLLDPRPGVQTRTERPVSEIGMQNILSLTQPEATTVPNLVCTPTVFTFVTTSSKWDRRESTTTVYSSDLSTLSTCSLASSCRCDSPVPSLCGSVVSNTTTDTGISSAADNQSYLKCETPQNSPLDGNTRPPSPTGSRSTIEANNRTFKTLFSVCDALFSTLGSIGSPRHNARELLSKAKRIDLMSKIGPLAEDYNHFHPPPMLRTEEPEEEEEIEDIFHRY